MKETDIVWVGVGRRVMNKEYLEAKAKLCLDQAEIDIQQQEIARAIKNLERANSALSRIFNLEEGENE
jgi:putative heme iron utilization protein